MSIYPSPGALRLLFSRTHVDLLTQIAAALIIAAVVAINVPLVSIAGWVSGLLIAMGLRYIIARAYLNTTPINHLWAWEGATGIAAFIVGLTWGLLAFIQGRIPLYAQDTIVVITAVVSATALWGAASSRTVFPAFILGLLVPWIIFIVSADTPPTGVTTAFAAFSVIYLGLFAFVHRQTSELLRHESFTAARQTSVAFATKANVVSQLASEPSVLTFITTLGEREQRPYSGVRRRASDFRGENPPALPKSSSFGQIKLQDAINQPLPNPADVIILLVEDNIDNQLVALHLLQKRGYQVVIANNGREALAAAERQRFSLILMDLQMPEMSGLEATAAIRLREKSGAKRIPIVALTANAASESREVCLAAGMDDFLSKPINRARLFASIDAQLSKKRS